MSQRTFFDNVRENRWFIAGGLTVALIAVILFSPHLTLQRRLLASAKKHEDLHEWVDAATDFERIVHYAPLSSIGLEAARLGGGIALYELKDYPKAVFFFRHIVRHSQKTVEVRWAQQKLAEIYYDKLNDYAQAIVEYQRLLQASPEPHDADEYKLKLGRAYFYMANFDQAISETDEYLANNPQASNRMDFLMLKADSLLAEKKVDEAIAAYTAIEKEFAGKADLSDVRMNKSLAYEDKKDWDSAVQELEAMKATYAHPDVLDLKIKSIIRRKERKKEL